MFTQLPKKHDTPEMQRIINKYPDLVPIILWAKGVKKPLNKYRPYSNWYSVKQEVIDILNGDWRAFDVVSRMLIDILP